MVRGREDVISRALKNVGAEELSGCRECETVVEVGLYEFGRSLEGKDEEERTAFCARDRKWRAHARRMLFTQYGTVRYGTVTRLAGTVASTNIPQKSNVGQRHQPATANQNRR